MITATSPSTLRDGHYIGTLTHFSHPDKWGYAWRQAPLPEKALAELKARYEEACLFVRAAGNLLNAAGVRVPILAGHDQSPASRRLFDKLLDEASKV